MATITLDDLSRAVARDLLDSTPAQKADTVRRIVSVRRALRLRDLAADLEKLEPRQLQYEALLGFGTEDYELAQADAEWLRDALQGRDWSERIDGQTGQKVTLPMPGAYLEGVANLMDAIAGALAQ